MKHPNRITAVISRNGNAYEEGLSEGWNPIRGYWEDARPPTVEAPHITGEALRVDGGTHLGKW